MQEKQKKEENEKRNLEHEIKKENMIYEYINNYLDPQKKFNDNLRFWDKWRSIEVSYGAEEIKEKIKTLKYKEFLSTPYWKTIAEKVRKFYNYKCAICADTKNINVHHKTYENHGKEHLYWKEDLILLCNNCHERFHTAEIE